MKPWTVYVRHLREEKAFEQVLVNTSQVVAEIDLEELKVPRQRRPPKRFTGDADGHVPTTVTDYYQPLYFMLVDTAIQQSAERFDSSSLNKYQALENVLLTETSTDIKDDLLGYEEIDWEDFQIQIGHFHRKRSIKCLSDAVSILAGMPPELRGEYSEVEKLVRLLLVSPASSAEAERSFSALRRLKTWLRSTMAQQRLNSVAVCHVHQEFLDLVDVNRLTDEFISRNDVRGSVFRI
jgi:hypothetical protein